MVIEVLDESLIAQLRSSSSIDSVTQCVTELVLNSLDSKSTSIAIRINLKTFRIQVIDNGEGISRANLEVVGKRYMTNRCHDLTDLKKHLKFYGFRGEALANIAKVSARVTITSREQDSDKSFEKIIEKKEHRIDEVKNRPSFGTTVTVEGFLANLPVRQQCVKNGEWENVKKSVESLIIVHPRVSFTLRNDEGAKLVLSSAKCQDVASSFESIHPEVDHKEFTFLKIKKSKVTVEGLIYKEGSQNKRLQYLYVNKRPINCVGLQNFINNLFRKNRKTEEKSKNPVFVIHIKCPYSYIDITLEPTKTVVFFKKLETVKNCIQKMLSSFFGEKKEVVEPKRRATSDFGLSQIGAIRGVGVKRKSDEVEETTSSKSAKIIEETPFFEEPKIPNILPKTALPIAVQKCEKKEIPLTEIADNSIFTNFPENEKRGKDLIMDMFIMSLQVYPPDEDTFQKPLIEENLQSSPKPQNRNTLGIQTSFKLFSAKEMVSVGVQTTSTTSLDLNFTFEPRKSMKKFVSDYDFDFSRIDSVPNFYQRESFLPFADFEQSVNQTRKLFDFKNHKNCNFFHAANESAFFQTDVFKSIAAKPVVESPYFVKKPLQNLPNIKPNANVIEISIAKKPVKKKLNESSVSKYFTPKKTMTTSQKCEKACQNYDESKDLFQFSKFSQESKSAKSESQLIITLNTEKNETHEKTENQNENFIAPTLSLTHNKQHNIQIAKNTKDADFKLKKDFSFELKERVDFVPKGLSPILKDYGKVDNLTPHSKEKLQNAIIKSYEDELMLIKWQNYIDVNDDPKKFFEEIYLEKSKSIESSVPNLYKKHTKGFEHLTFTKSFFNNLEVVGQVDFKFIAVLDKSKNLLLLFDQHAVHERVRLEELSESYKSTSTKLDQNITIFLPHSELSWFKKQEKSLKLLGLDFCFFTNGMTIFEVPLCIYNKSRKGADIVSLTEQLIKEIIETLKNNNGVIVNTPKVIQNIVNSEACRGAIKFGDSLSKTECQQHLKKLSECKLPFQCAHGRPTLTPLIFLNNFYNPVITKPNLNKLK